ncbi:MAG TPA: FUSC family protein [Microbacterium sp.]|nr:FUSC family protein [Microbacterium sp.]
MTSPEPAAPGARLRAEARAVAGSLFAFGPSRGRRWPLALQAALAMAVPVVVLALTGHDDLALLAATGAFTVIYGSWLRPRERARFAPLVALVLLACAAAGALAAAGGTATVLVGVLAVTVGAAALAGWISLGPPGPIFFVLVFGLSAHLTAAGAVTPGPFLTVVAASSGFAVLLVLAPLLLPRYRREAARPLRELFPRRWSAAAGALTQRAAIVGLVGVIAAAFVDPERSYWIVSAGLAVVGMPVGRREATIRGVHRTVGTVVGAGLYLALALLPLPMWALGLLLGALQFVIELVVVRHYALALVFITPLVLLIIGSAGGETTSFALALERVADTIIGAVVGTAAALAVRRLRAD